MFGTLHLASIEHLCVMEVHVVCVNGEDPHLPYKDALSMKVPP